jgi:HAE1 family hydrophobic/amphiphilic exporter-1
MDELETKLQAIPGIEAAFEPWQLITPGIDFDALGHYQLVVKGGDYESIATAAGEIRDKLHKIPDVTYVDTSFGKEIPFLLININEEKVFQYGLDKQRVQNLLQQAFGRTNVGFLQNGAFREDITLELPPEYQKRIDAPSKLYCASSDGKIVPFKAFASWEERLGVSSLRRDETLPSSTIHFSLSDRVPINKGLAMIEKTAAEAISSDTVSVALSGSAKTISSTIRSTLLLLLAAAAVMHTILGILYESFIHPLTILSSIPLAGLGGILTLFITNEPLSIFSAVGFLLLIGIVKKNGIMMVDYALDRQREGISANDAIVEACDIRFRPIMMTTIAAIMGAVPLAIGLGESGEMLRGLGLVIVGGLLFSQVLTLYLTPVLYITFSGHKNEH